MELNRPPSSSTASELKIGSCLTYMGRNMGVTLYTFEVPLGTPMKKVGTSGTPMLEALLKV